MTSEAHEKESLEDLAWEGRLRDAPHSEIKIQVDEQRILLDGSQSRPAQKAGTPIQSYLWSARDDNPEAMTILEPEDQAGQPLTGEVASDRLVLQTPAKDGEYFLSLKVLDQNGCSDTSATYFIVEDGRPRLSDWSTENTQWVERAVIYGVIPRNFGPRGLADVTERLDDLKDLGVTALWLAPINTNPEGDYGYRTMNYFEVAPRVGNKDDLRHLVQEAHRRGIRVMMDFVPNHTSEQHRYFQDTLENGPASPYWDFFDRDESGTHTHYFHWTYLPNLNFNNPKVVRWITEAFAYWVREFDVDGFRVDVAWGIRQRNPEYWPMCRQALKRIKPDILLLAEAGARDDYYFTEGFDSAYDWTDELGHGAWEHVFDDPQQITERLHAALTNHGKGFHEDALILHFLNNNDTAERFLTRYGLGMSRVATALLLTLPGLPCLYTGDEIGAEFLPYKNPEPLDWAADPHNLRDYHQKLIALRKEIPALHSRQWEILEVKPREKVFAYLRTTETGDSPVLVLLNFSEETTAAEVSLPIRYQPIAPDGQMRELLSGKMIEAGSQDVLTVQIPPLTAYILAAN